MMKKFGNALMMLAAATSMTLAAIPEAQARHGRGAAVGVGVAAGIIGLGILGAAAADRPRYYSRYDEGRCYRGPLECRRTARRCYDNEYGDTICRGGREICERPVICD